MRVLIRLIYRHQADDDDISGLMCVPLCIPKKHDIGLRNYVEQRVRSTWNVCSAEDIKLKNSVLSHRLKWETGRPILEFLVVSKYKCIQNHETLTFPFLSRN